MIQEELEKITKLTGVDESRIQLSDDGFTSRGYVIDGGQRVVKFRKQAGTSYVEEARVLDYLSGMDLGVRLQSTEYLADDDSCIVLKGVPGISLEQYPLDDAARRNVGDQLGRFLRNLHALKPPVQTAYTLDDLIGAWQARYQKAKPTLEQHFSHEELRRIDELMVQEMPQTLQALGDTPVFSHADLGDGNILVDEDGRVGIIDFNSPGYMDEASDFMDVSDDALCAVMLDVYGADEDLRKKVQMQRRIRAVFVIDVYAERGKESVEKLAAQIREKILRD